MSDVNTLEDALDMNVEIGKITNKEKIAKELNEAILNEKEKCRSRNDQSVIYLIWNNPFMCAGKNTFIDSMIESAGLKNAITEERYPEITIEEISKNKPTLLLLSTEPFPFDFNHLTKLKDQLPDTEVKLVDGEMFSWYGSRLLKSFAYFNEIFK